MDSSDAELFDQYIETNWGTQKVAVKRQTRKTKQAK